MKQKNKNASGERMTALLLRMAEAGRGPDGGITRLAFSRTYFEGASAMYDLLRREYDCSVYRDFAGNLHAVRAGSCPGLPEMVIGSHLDTVPDGGMFDGAAGIAAGMECLRLLSEEGRELRHGLHLILFNAEEAGPLGGTFGSRALLGQADLETEEVKEALQLAEKYMGSIPKREPGLAHIKCFLELHVEQGGVLEDEKLDIGVVNGIFGIRRYRIRMVGESNHAGTTPMDRRKDPLAAAAGLIAFIYEEAKTYGGGLVATVGKIQVQPNLESVIPGEAEITLEVRSLSEEQMDRFWQSVRRFSEACLTAGQLVSWESQLMVNKPPLTLNGEMMAAVEKACRMRGASFRIMSSGAGHDAKSFGAAGIPVGMIFVPSAGGKSHCKEEFTSASQLAVGAEVFHQTILLLDSC